MTTLLKNITPIVDERSLWRYLGYPHGETPDDRVRETLVKQKGLLPDLLQPRGVYGRFAAHTCFNQSFPLYECDIFLCVVTIGERLEIRAAEHAARGDVLAGFVLDTLGSVYAEGTAEAAYQTFAELARRDELTIGCRISPGYGEWTLNDQQGIFQLLPTERIGVRLTPGLMMVPRKSVSFAVERSSQPLPLRQGEQCDYCTLQHCRYRRERPQASE